jgi:nitroreductase
MDRRRFLKILLAGTTGTMLNRSFGRTLNGYFAGTRALPAVQINTYSSEIVMNSRRSYHSGYSGALSDQILGNILWACSRAPLIGANRIIYVARPDNVYRYDPVAHDIVLHLAGNHMSESNCAFEVGVAADLAEDAGAALGYGALAPEAFWLTTSNRPIGIPKESAATNANSTWTPALTVQMVNCHGLMGTVSGITNQLVAISSDGTLPNPITDGTVILENGLSNLGYGTQFSATSLTLNELSQLAWASYGNTPHTAGSKAALTIASAAMNYYLTGRIYMVRPEGVERYHIRQTSGSQSTRDHRIERVLTGDRRPQLRAAIARLPQTAPAYFVYCAATATRWQLIESGYAAASALLQATSLNLQGHFTANFNSSERTAISTALGIPTGDLTLEIFSCGQPLVGVGERNRGPVQYLTANPNPFKHRTEIRYGLASSQTVELEVHDVSGRRIKVLAGAPGLSGDHRAAWNGDDQRGKHVPGGVYYLVLRAGSVTRREKVVKL